VSVTINVLQTRLAKLGFVREISLPWCLCSAVLLISKLHIYGSYLFPPCEERCTKFNPCYASSTQAL
jgi:hypothetical protein